MKGVFKTYILLFFCTCFAVVAHAQSATDSTKTADSIKHANTVTMPVRVTAKPVFKKPKGPKPIHKEMSGGGHLNSNGWSLFIDRGKIKTDDEKHSDMFYNVRLLQVEFEEIKNPKEYKISATDVNPYTGSRSGAYIYGKENNFYAVKLGWGFRKMIAGKPDQGTVSIHWVNVGGLALGLLKPYYLKVNINGGQQEIKYSDSTKDYFLNQGYIVGKSSVTKGIGEMKFIPGFHFKSGLHFDFANNRKLLLAAETGIGAEIYTQSITLLANQKAVPYFINVYLALEFGKRW